ncbi:recombination-associated protein RdgC [Alteromonas lipotrueiana]|uniref:recombination-associated protein RdgC n=1 Tax=Alteromonas lipotrueiana TaxID=2803815 RepID=UPI001C4538B6|nr:recombination-associated protein RdgC [Alteromonas lipotrueiana]
MWFKNIKAYQLTQPLSLDEDDLQNALSEFSFRPCGSQDLNTMGFVPPLSAAGESTMMFHQVQQRYWITLKKQERILPATVINSELAEKVAQIEAETGAAVGKKAQSDLKQEIITRLLPQAFTKNTYTHGFISIPDKMVIIDSSSDGKAEAFLAMVRKAITSLPVVPMARRSLQSELTHWLTDGAPDGIELLEEAELKSTDDLESVIRCKNQPLDSEEIELHLNSGKLVQKIGFAWQESLSAVAAEDGSFKRIKFTDRVKEETGDIPKDQVHARLDAEFTLMSAELCQFLDYMRTTLKLTDDV